MDDFRIIIKKEICGREEKESKVCKYAGGCKIIADRLINLLIS